jgi:(E)-4-hydroxy-3-methylbut-2-enyl-diphosphate synthase
VNARRKSIPIRLGNLTVGGDSPVTVQSMAKTDTRDAPATIRQIKELEEAGCEIIRVAVPDMEAAGALPAIKKAIRIPLVADIHFDHRLALAACAAGVDGLRLNPGNISQPDKVEALVRAAAERAVPIRIGVNAGSLPPAESPAAGVSQRMVAAALAQISLLESLDFNLIKVSLKAFDVPTTIEAYRDIAGRIPYPLHIGITEAGTPRAGIIRSAVGIGSLLNMGIGDTIRVSLTAPPREEVAAGYEILKSLGLRQRGPVLVSCPQCGRSEVDIIDLASRVERELQRFTKPIRVAVMGCVVNGPGEAADADIGVACGKGRAVLFKRGQRIGTVAEEDILASLVREIEQM